MTEISEIERSCVEYWRKLPAAGRMSTMRAFLEGCLAACRATDSLAETDVAILLARFDLYGFDGLTPPV